MNNAIETYKNTAAEIEAWGCTVEAVFGRIVRGAGVDIAVAGLTCDGVAMGAMLLAWDARGFDPMIMVREAPRDMPAEVVTSIAAHVRACIRAANEAQTIRRRA